MRFMQPMDTQDSFAEWWINISVKKGTDHNNLSLIFMAHIVFYWIKNKYK